jgi:hypothetical protein
MRHPAPANSINHPIDEAKRLRRGKQGRGYLHVISKKIADALRFVTPPEF